MARKDANGVLHQTGFSYLPEIIRTKLISRHHDGPLAGHFGIEKTDELVARKCYWPTWQHNVEAYVKGCNVCLAFKAVHHKRYGNMHSLPVLTNCWKNLSIDFVIGLPIFTNWKGNSFDSILVIVERFTNMVHYELVKVTIDAPSVT